VDLTHGERRLGACQVEDDQVVDQLGPAEGFEVSGNGVNGLAGSPRWSGFGPVCQP
jgi:hypothetical protein